MVFDQLWFQSVLVRITLLQKVEYIGNQSGVERLLLEPFLVVVTVSMQQALEEATRGAPHQSSSSGEDFNERGFQYFFWCHAFVPQH